MSARYVSAARLGEVRAELSERDEAVLRRVSTLRFVSGDQLARMHFEGSSARAARRALLRLVGLDCLVRLPRRVGGKQSGSRSFIYGLGATGQRLAMERGWLPARRTRRPYVPGTLFLGHALQVAELHSLLVEADRSGRIELLELSAEPACWRELRGIGTQRVLKPDSYVRLGVGNYEDSYWVEVDMGTEGSQTLDWKLKEYVAYEASGIEQEQRGVFPKTLWLVPDSQRAGIIEACIGRLSRPAQRLFAVTLFANALGVVANTPNVTSTQPGGCGQR